MRIPHSERNIRRKSLRGEGPDGRTPFDTHGDWRRFIREITAETGKRVQDLRKPTTRAIFHGSWTPFTVAR